MAGIDANTVLMLHCDGADESTSFIDDSGSDHTVTPSGNAQIDTAQSVFGGASALFDGTGDSLALDGSSDFAFATDDFTIDLRVRFNTGGAGTQIIYDGRPTGTDTTQPTIYLAGGVLRYYTNGANRIIGGTSLSAEVWYHIALVRTSGTTKLFLDGTQEGLDYTDSTNYTNSSSRPLLSLDGSTGGSGFRGWLDEIRVSKGIARWTSNFTPPTEAYSENSQQQSTVMTTHRVYDMIITCSDNFTRPSNTTAYADGDLVANNTTAGNVTPLTFSVARLTVGRGIIRAARLFKDDETVSSVTFNIHLFSQSPTVNNGDNSAFQPATMEYWLGVIPVDFGTNGVVSDTDAIVRGAPSSEINFDLWEFNQTERRLYGLIEATGAYTPASAELFEVTLEIAST